MFTGLVEAVGRLESLERRGEGARVVVDAGPLTDGLARGDSVAVNGCCLTAVDVAPGRFAADLVPETLRRTTFGGLGAGARVNLERPLRFDARLGGHLVQGHVDGVGRVAAVHPEGDGRRVRLELPAELARYVAEKGSLAVDGVSLTVAACSERTCDIAYVPHTLGATIAGDYAEGDRVNLEVDLLARYVARLMDASIGERT